MKTMLCALIAFCAISTELVASCQRYLVIEKSRVIVELNNTKHDRLGNFDEIELKLATSYDQLETDDFFSWFSGDTLYKTSPDFNIGKSKTDVPFNTKAVIFDQEIDHSLLYNKFLNVLVFENDIAVPLASGSIEVPFYVFTGGNHDDLMFSESIPTESEIELQNRDQDQLKITITPAKTSLLTLKELNERIQLLMKSSTVSAREVKLVNQKIRYLDDLAKGKVENSCKK